MPSVGFYVRDDGTVLHAHVMGGSSTSDRQQWHPPEQFHRVDPYAHDREDHWDLSQINWSKKNWDIGRPERMKMLEKAREAYIVNMRYAGYEPRVLLHALDAPPPTPAPTYTPEPELEEVPVPVTDEEEELSPVTDADPDMQAAEDEILDLLTQLPDRVDALEKNSAAQRRTIDAQNTRIDNIASTAAGAQGKMLTLSDIATQLAGRVDALEQATAKKIEFVVRKDDQPEKRIIGTYHAKFQYLVDLVTKLDHEDRNVWMAGPAGSGKTTAAMALADILDLPYDFHPAIDMPHSLVGYMDAKGEYVSTAYRRRYEHGGVVLLDEVDASNPNALMVLNASLSGPKMSFPDKLVDRHPDCIVLCAANTWGHGGTANYIGRFAQDDAFLDRFVYIDWQYDEAFERSLSLDDEWCSIVQTVRARAVTQKAKLVISPRASIKGSKLLARGMNPEDVVQAIFGRYRQINDWRVIGAAAEEFAKKPRAITEQPSSNGLSKVDFSHVS